jgi:NADP-dependent 3-hydroxy acid dehydrogenase YdfG
MLKPASCLKDLVAVITGGSEGIGKASAQLLLQHGAKVVTCSRRSIPENVKLGIYHLPCDVRDTEQVKSTVQKILKQFGRIDLLLNSAGVSMPEPLYLEQVEIDLWNRILDTNLKGTFLFCREVLPILKKQGTGYIINILSTAAYRSQGKNAPYSASKAAIRAVTEALVEETKGSAIRVTSISPGPVSTNIWSHKRRIVTEEERSHMLKPEDIAEIILFLLLLNDYVQVQNITVTPRFAD